MKLPPELESNAGDARPWHRWYEQGVPRSINVPDWTLPEVLSRTSARYPERVAIRFFGHSILYRELDEAVSRFANALVGLGVKPGDRVALYLPNCPQIVIAYYGALRAGAVVVPANPTYTPPELQHQLEDAGARVVVCLSLLFPRVQQVRADLPGLEQVIVTNIKEYFPAVTQALFSLTRERREGHRVELPRDGHTHDWHELLAKSAPSDPGRTGGAEELAVIQYTLGTTGTPKGVMLTQRNLLAAVLQAHAWTANAVPADGTDIVLGIAPIFHMYGQDTVLNFPIFGGGAMVLLPQFSVAEVLKAIDGERPDLFPGVPALYAVLSESRDVGGYDLRSLKASICGAASLPREVQERFEQLSGAPVVAGYGLSEAMVTHCNPILGTRKTGSIGIPIPGTDAAVVDPDSGARLGAGQPGELAVRGPQVMTGYWRRDDETQRVLRDGWLRTGDIAVMDDDGFFTLVDRIKEMINVGGLKVFPSEVETILQQYPGVKEAAVIGVTSLHRGEMVKAFVVLEDGAAVTAPELIGYCREHLAPYKVPRAVEIRTDLPRNLLGKVLKRSLVEEERRREIGSATMPSEPG